MELTSEQKHDISVELNASDIYETVPFLNKVLAAIGYVDRLDDDSEREELRWTKRKEPIIKDKKIRKAVRAWAEMNDIRFIHMCSRTRKENARIVGQNALGRTFTMEIDNEYEIRVCFKDYKECYTIAELCGEEEE